MGEYYESKKCKLLWVAWAFGIVGIDNGILGPSLLDLGSLIQAQLYQMNWLFIISGIGFILGCLLVGWMSSKINMDLILAVSMLLGSATFIFIPLARNLPLMATLFFIQGLTKGLVDVGCLITCNWLFPTKHNWEMQLITVVASFTAFVIPFIVLPFQSHKLHMFSEDTQLRNMSYINPHSHNNITKDDPTNIQYAYLIAAFITSPPIIAFFYYYIRSGCHSWSNQSDYEDMTGKILGQKYPLVKKTKMLVLLFLFHIPIFGITIAYSNLLTAYGLSTSRNFTKADLAFMTSVMWGSFLMGRILTTVFSKIFDIGILLTLNFGGLFLFVSLLVVQIYIPNEALLWIGTSGFGLFQSSFLPTVISWAGGFLTIDAVILTTALVASGIGEMTIPFIAGIFFHSLGPSSLIYLMLGNCCLEFAMFAMMGFLNNYYRKNYLI
ncbi:sodium-dependent glucose transporter 1A [Octopus sinensis]|nr:sodium-dependent glucose transporter 1A [Octopus sinensis]XP_029633450.1 sodium-dependent glucose transporter 1A [Octopus sinensis]XP_029633451.1 sodium-dependent glucose transporter 1A [Octopus sinensis]XP_029633452.1 sodium-dependent glucose transporter 1A [Octopus sinensis]XP_029633453.1 sodium-dependent glucose transporter 1A [Octopus sinensis]